ncbi:uncharacterized protein (DUF885 family) [Neolewinella xylanilytica]|uniref:Uncharacterized protein (DUF885 family) n=1 Tax=Neolewinella xylanilytica TaxID=1514080 RepID=A0A2S6I202_9BACT|nr:DUF885 domain-containing protein [Neolewinella xylanilytica]PPK85205.1 uncharacterized protein (DUF885 family) [Neolewinella xylanilytica]
MRSVLFLLLFPLLAFGQADSSALQVLLADYQAYERYDTTNLWGSRAAGQVEEELEAMQAFQHRLAAITETADSLNIDRELLEFVLEDRIYRLRFGTYQFPLNAEGGFLTDIVYRFGNRRVRSEGELDRYLRELRAIPAHFRAQQAAMQDGLAGKRTNPRLVVDRVLALIDRTLDPETGRLLFLQPVADYNPGVDSVNAVLQQEVLPAYQELRNYLEREYLPQLPREPGISSIEGGKDYYRHLIRYFTTTEEMTPEEVFETGMREVERIRSEMEKVMESTGFEGSFAEFLRFLRTDAQFYAQSPAELLERAAWITKRMEGKLPDYFVQLPRMPLTVSPVPASLAPNYTGGRYSPGSYRSRRAGAFWVNTYDLPSRPFYTLPALALHEGVPGHHTQMMLAEEQEGQSNFRKGLYLSAFGEGWALYCEYLGKEAGMYETAYEDFGRLTYEMWRACRLVVDPGIHYMGWSRERAVTFMAENTALSMREVNSEIDRYIGWPGQAVSYKMGELTIRRLRQEAEAALGETFDLAEFHNLVLANGSVTMSLLERIVRRYVAERTED